MDIYNSDSDSDIEILHELNNMNMYYNRPYVIRKRDNHFDKWDDIEFVRRFRVSKYSAREILNDIGGEIKHPTTRNKALSAMDQLLLTLRFYATGCMQQTAGDFSGVHQTTAGKAIRRVTEAMAAKRSRYIKHLTPTQQETNQNQFYSIARFPRVYGALDCTHIRIQSPGGPNSENFRNRKGYFSLNVQGLCGSNLQFLDVVARWPGASHDSTIFHNSSLCALFESRQLGHSVILGDSGYPLKNYLLTPVMNPTTAAEKLYNESHIRTRNCIERCFGIWKRRFPVLSLGMRIDMNLIQDTVIACAILHNICMKNDDEVPNLEDHIQERIDISSSTSDYSQNVNSNTHMRRQILINSHQSLYSKIYK